MSWSPDGTRIVSSAVGRDQVLVWDAQTGQTLLTYQDPPPPNTPVTHFLNGVTWSPNGKYIAFYRDSNVASDNKIYVMDATTGQLRLSLPVDQAVEVLTWSPDSTRLVYGTYDNTERIITATTGQLLVTYTGHTGTGEYGGITSLSWSPNGKYIASGGMDTTVQIWNAADGQPVYTYTGHTAFIGAVAWSPNSTRIASSSAQQIQVWDAFTGQHVFIYSGHHLRVQGLAWSPNGTRIASVSGDNAQGEAQVWQAA